MARELCTGCFAAQAAWRGRPADTRKAPTDPGDRERYVKALAAALLSDAGLLVALLNPKDSLTAMGLQRIVFTIDERTDEVAVSTLDKYGMVRPLAAYRASQLWELAGETQQAIDDAADEHEDGV